MFFSAEIAFFRLFCFCARKKVFACAFPRSPVFYGGFIVPLAQTFFSLDFFLQCVICFFYGFITLKIALNRFFFNKFYAAIFFTFGVFDDKISDKRRIALWRTILGKRN